MTATTGVATGVRTPQRSFGLDVCRALAAFGVLVTHVGFATGIVAPERWDSPLRALIPRLDVGVTVFFVLSGLLVGRPFVRRYLAAAPAPDLRRYGLRRVSRIYPAYWVALAVALITVGRGTWGEVVADVLLLHVYRPDWAIGPITQSWTLATEIAFYAFVPLWFVLLGRWSTARGHDRAARVRTVAWSLAAWAAIALAWRLGVLAGTPLYVVGDATAVDTRGALLTWLPNHLDAFAIGTGLAVWLEAGRARPMPVAARVGCYAAALAALWWVSHGLGLSPAFTGFDGPQTLGRHLGFLVVAAGVVVPSALSTAAPAGARAWRPTPLVATVASGAALASYGVYLWHQWVTEEWFAVRGYVDFAAPVLSSLVVVAVVSTCIAGVTYWAVERPAATVALGIGGGTPRLPTRRLGPQPQLDGLRGLAVLAVLAVHVVFLDDGSSTWALRGGFLGVDVFIVLSAFLIAAVILREVDDSGSLDGGGFARRRARRLYPPLLVFFAVAGPVSIIVLSTSVGETIRQAVLALTYVANWQLSFGHQPPFEYVHLWSLSVEAQFYVLMALGLWAWRHRLGRSNVVVAWLLLGSVAVLLWRLFLYRRGVDTVALYERTGTRADSMLLGVAAALVWRSRLVADRWIRAAGVLGAMVLAVLAVAAEPAQPWLYEGGFTLVALAAAALVAAAATGSGLVARLGQLRALRWVGGMSYSLYLWHLPIYLWVVRAMPDAPLPAKLAVAVGGSFAAAWLSFRLVESRALAGWRRSTQGDAPQSTTPSSPTSR